MKKIIMIGSCLLASLLVVGLMTYAQPEMGKQGAFIPSKEAGPGNTSQQSKKALSASVYSGQYATKEKPDPNNNSLLNILDGVNTQLGHLQRFGSTQTQQE